VFMSGVDLPICQPYTIAVHEPAWDIVAHRFPVHSWRPNTFEIQMFAPLKLLLSDVIKLIPPLVMTESDCDWFLQAFDDVMQKLHRFPGPVWEALSNIGKHALRGRRKTSAVRMPAKRTSRSPAKYTSATVRASTRPRLIHNRRSVVARITTPSSVFAFQETAGTRRLLTWRFVIE
jgi:hypothetical protein